MFIYLVWHVGKPPIWQLGIRHNLILEYAVSSTYRRTYVIRCYPYNFNVYLSKYILQLQQNEKQVTQQATFQPYPQA